MAFTRALCSKTWSLGSLFLLLSKLWLAVICPRSDLVHVLGFSAARQWSLDAEGPLAKSCADDGRGRELAERRQDWKLIAGSDAQVE